MQKYLFEEIFLVQRCLYISILHENYLVCVCIQGINEMVLHYTRYLVAVDARACYKRLVGRAALV